MAIYASELTDPKEIELWEKISALERKTLYTSGRGSRLGVEFSFTIPTYVDPVTHQETKGAELRISNRQKTITRSTVMLAYRKAVEMNGQVGGPKSLGNIYGASYVYAIFKEIGIIQADKVSAQ